MVIIDPTKKLSLSFIGIRELLKLNRSVGAAIINDSITYFTHNYLLKAGPKVNF